MQVSFEVYDYDDYFNTVFVYLTEIGIKLVIDCSYLGDEDVSEYEIDFCLDDFFNGGSENKNYIKIVEIHDAEKDINEIIELIIEADNISTTIKKFLIEKLK